MRTRLVGLALLLVPACSAASDAASTTTPPVTSSSTSSTVPAFDSDEVPPLALFLAAIDAGLEGTELEGAAFEEAEALIDTGVVFCGLLEDGLTPRDVLRGWVAALSSSGMDPSEDDFLLGGLVLGSSVRFMCPDFLDELDL